MRTLLLVSLILYMTSLVDAADWPGFAGPNGNASSPETGLMKKWPAGGPKELWKVDVGPGFGGVAIKGQDLYILDRVPEESDVLRCLTLSTGKEQWRISYPAPGKISHSGSRSHPAVDDKYVFIYSPFGELRCIDKKARKVIWTKDTMKDYQAPKPNWAYTQCPLLYKDMVIVAPVGSSATAVAFDKATGKVAWKSGVVEGKASYASPMLATIDGVDQILILTTITTAGIDAATGKTLWSTDAYKCRIPIASPVHVKDGLVFVTGGYDAGCAMFKVKKTGETFSVSTAFQNMNSNGQIHQPVLYKDHLYLNGNDKKKRNGFICLDLEGNLKWETGTNPGFDWGGVLLADDIIYTVDANKGDLCMIKPDPSGYKELGRANFLGGSKIWGTIALSDGKILLRDQKQLKCVDVKSN